MGTLSLSDPAAVTSVYSSIIDNENNWLLLHYEDDLVNDLSLYSFGNEGLEELKNKISDLNKVFLAFYRDDEQGEPGYIIVNYIPPSSPLRRAQVLVHSRHLGTIFKKHQAIFTIDSLSLLTTANVRQAILRPDIPINPASSVYLPKALEEEGEQSRDLPMIPYILGNRPSELVIPTIEAPRPVRENSMLGILHAPDHHGARSPKTFLAGLLKRKKKNKSIEEEEEYLGLPPPIPPKSSPPKDKGLYHIPPVVVSHSPPLPPRSRRSQDDKAVRYRRSRSLSDFRPVSHLEFPSDHHHHPVVEPEPFQLSVPLLKGKWAPEPPFSSDPAERARRRRELQLQRERDEREAREEELRRQERIKKEKEELARQEAEEERRRKVEVEDEIRRMREERRRREEMEREEEERKRVELEERRRQNRDRRLEEHRRLERWRMEQARKAEAAARLAEEGKRREEMERQKKIQEAASKLLLKEDARKQESGWITIFSEDALAWKRRYYKFAGNTIVLYKDMKDLTAPLEEIELEGIVKGLKEWNEGHEDLEAIPFSFVVEFNDGRPFWSMFADTEEEKFKVLGLFKVAGGI